MTEYEATQKQRYIERQIRKYKREVAGLDAAGIDSTDSRNRLAKWQQRQRDFIEQTGLKRDYSREKYYGGGVDKSGESGIIKAISIEDISSADKDGAISEDCKRIIAETLSKYEKEGHNFRFDDVRIVDIPPHKNGGVDVLRTNAVDRYGYPQVVLEINQSVFAGVNKTDIDNMFFLANNTKCNSLEDAVVHEIGHAKTIYSRSYPNYERINEELSSVHFKGISNLAESDGLECIAECEVLLSHGEKLSDELMEFYKKYTTGGG